MHREKTGAVCHWEWKDELSGKETKERSLVALSLCRSSRPDWADWAVCLISSKWHEGMNLNTLCLACAASLLGCALVIKSPRRPSTTITFNLIKTKFSCKYSACSSNSYSETVSKNTLDCSYCTSLLSALKSNFDQKEEFLSEEEGGFFPVNKQLYTLSVQSGTALSVNSYLRLSQKVDVRCVGHKA